ELVCRKFDFKKHFDRGKLGRFLKLAGITRTLGVPEMLENLGAAERQEGKIVVNNTGALYFAKNLDDLYKHTVVTCALYKGTEKVDVLDRKDFNEDILSNIDQAMLFLKRHLSLRYEMTGAPRRREILEIPEGALREAVINAVVHRDYFERGANVMVEIFDDRVEISNPGGLVKGLKPEDFGKKSILRNPTLASLLHRADYIEKMGTGITRMRKLMREARLPAPRFDYDTFFAVVLKRPLRRENISKLDEAVHRSVSKVLSDAGVEGTAEVTRRLSLILARMQERGFITTAETEGIFHVSQKTAKRALALLRELKIIIFHGAPKTGKYVFTTRGRKLLKTKKGKG
ncbi:MAG: ATP-binding protein, partial [Bacteroidota bacterium]